MLRAVLFDWGDTLLRYHGAIDAEFALARTRVGLAALRRDGLPTPADISRWFETRIVELANADSEDEVEWLPVVAACFADLGCELSDDDLRLYAAASLWENELEVEPEVHRLLDALRADSLALAIVSNTVLPLWLVEPAFARQGLAQRVDVIALSSEVGKRKPHPAIFEQALAELGVRPDEAVFVGDRRYQDVEGARGVGMRTIQALWFREDDRPGAEPDHRARALTDVLRIVGDLRRDA